MACATITERSVAYEILDDFNSRKLFEAADYDYFYKNYLENKTVMKYETLNNRNNLDYLNKHNMIINNPKSLNLKEFNYKKIIVIVVYWTQIYKKKRILILDLMITLEQNPLILTFQ